MNDNIAKLRIKEAERSGDIRKLLAAAEEAKREASALPVHEAGAFQPCRYVYARC